MMKFWKLVRFGTTDFSLRSGENMKTEMTSH